MEGVKVVIGNMHRGQELQNSGVGPTFPSLKFDLRLSISSSISRRTATSQIAGELHAKRHEDASRRADFHHTATAMRSISKRQDDFTAACS